MFESLMTVELVKSVCTSAFFSASFSVLLVGSRVLPCDFVSYGVSGSVVIAELPFVGTGSEVLGFPSSSFGISFLFSGFSKTT